MITNKNFITHGYLALANAFGIEIMLWNETLYYRFNGETPDEPVEATIKYNGAGEPYFTVGKVRYYLKEFMRSN